MQRKLVMRVLAFAIVLLVGFLLGSRYGAYSGADTLLPRSVSGKSADVPFRVSKPIPFSLYWDVWNRIQKDYVDAPHGEDNLLYGSIAGMVASLGDPYSLFFTPKEANEFTSDLSGEFEGIGAEIGVRKEQLVIITPLAGSPAERAGLRSGDAIIAIDDENTLGISVDAAVKKIRGTKGTTVVLTIVRDQGEPKDISIVRNRIVVKSVESEYVESPDGKRLFHLKVRNFDDQFSASLRTVLQAAVSEKYDGIILDVRGNPGGFLEAAIELAELWVSPGDVIVWEAFSESELESKTAVQEPIFNTVPTVVLVNKGSASGSEIVAGALQDLGLATVIGEQSFGKGSVQNFERFPDGSGLKLTIARWLTPLKHTIDKTGITPDIAVPLDEKDLDSGRDPQLDAARAFFDAKR